jgi:hypothetical protein
LSYADRLAEAGSTGAKADELLRAFAHEHGLNIEESNASLKVSGVDRRSVVLQPSPGAGVGTAGLRVQFHRVPTAAAQLGAAIQAVGGRPENLFSLVPLHLVLERWGEIRETILQPFFKLSEGRRPSLHAGQRVRLRRQVERFPHASVAAGAIGIVVATGPRFFSVRLETPVDGLEEWSNELRWEDMASAEADVEDAGEDSSAQSIGYFTAYWGPGPWNSNAGKPIAWAASDGFAARGVSVGDTVYLVHYENREVFVGARLRVAEVLTEEQARQRLDPEGLWDARDYVLAAPGTEEQLNPDRIVARDLLRQLVFIRPSDGSDSGIRFDSDGAANQQALRTVRQMTADSARMLDELIDGP